MSAQNEPAIGGVSIARISAKTWRAFAWRDVILDTPTGTPLFHVDGTTLGHAMHEMLLVVRGEKPWPGART